jgi:hypothetical protein
MANGSAISLARLLSADLAVLSCRKEGRFFLKKTGRVKKNLPIGRFTFFKILRL